MTSTTIKERLRKMADGMYAAKNFAAASDIENTIDYITDLEDRHWDECAQISAYDEELRIGVNQYQRDALRTSGTMDPGDLLVEGVMGLCGESGECVDIVKKHVFQSHKLDSEHLAEELGDVAWYLAITAHAIGYDLSAILAGNIRKLRERYPDGFDAEKSVNRERTVKRDG